MKTRWSHVRHFKWQRSSHSAGFFSVINNHYGSYIGFGPFQYVVRNGDTFDFFCFRDWSRTIYATTRSVILHLILDGCCLRERPVYIDVLENHCFEGKGIFSDLSLGGRRPDRAWLIGISLSAIPLMPNTVQLPSSLALALKESISTSVALNFLNIAFFSFGVAYFDDS